MEKVQRNRRWPFFFFFWRCHRSDQFFGQKFGAPQMGLRSYAHASAFLVRKYLRLHCSALPQDSSQWFIVVDGLDQGWQTFFIEWITNGILPWKKEKVDRIFNNFGNDALKIKSSFLTTPNFSNCSSWFSKKKYLHLYLGQILRVNL